MSKCKFFEYTQRQVDNNFNAPYYSYGNLLNRCKCVDCIKEKEYYEKIKK